MDLLGGDAGVDPAVDPGVVVAQLAQDGAGVAADLGHRVGEAQRRAGEARVGGGRIVDRTAGRVVEQADHRDRRPVAPRCAFSVGHLAQAGAAHVFDAVDPVAAESRGVERGLPVGHRPLRDGSLQGGDPRGLFGHLDRHCRQLRDLVQPRQILRQPGQHQPAVGGAVHVLQGVRAQDLLPLWTVVGPGIGGGPHEGRLHQLPALRQGGEHQVAAALALAAQQGQGDAVGAGVSGQVVDAGGEAVQLGRRAGAAVTVLDTRSRLQHRIEAGQLGPRTAPRPIERGQVEVDDAGVDARQAGVVDAEPLGDAGPEVVHDHVGAAGQLLEQASAFLLLEVQDHAALALAYFHVQHVRGPGTEVGIGCVDLDHVGAILRQGAGATGAGQHGGQVEHLDTGENGRRARGRVGRPAGGAGAVGRRGREIAQQGVEVDGPRRPRHVPPPVGAAQRGLHAELANRSMRRVHDLHGERRDIGLRRVQPLLCAAVDAERHPELAHDRRPVVRRLLPEGSRHAVAEGFLPLPRQAVDVLDVVGPREVGVGRQVDHAVGDQAVVDPQRLGELDRVAAAVSGEQEHPAAVASSVAVEQRRQPGADLVYQPAALGRVGLPHACAQFVVGGIGTLAVARRRIGNAQQEGAHRRHRGPGQRHLDHLAAPALLAGVERKGYRQRSVDGAVGGGQRDRRILRRRLQLAANRMQVGKQPGGGAEDPFEGAQRSAFLAGAEARQRQVHQPWVGGRHGGGAQPEPFHHPGTEVLDHHVRRGHQSPCGLAAGSALQVQLQDLLAAVEYRARGGGAGRVAGAIHLDDLGALVGQQHAGERPREVVAEVDDPMPRQRREVLTDPMVFLE